MSSSSADDSPPPLPAASATAQPISVVPDAEPIAAVAVPSSASRPDFDQAVIDSVATAEPLPEVAPPTRPAEPLPPPNVAITSDGRLVKTQRCSYCGHFQELPAIFCDECHSPLLRIPKFFLLLFLSLSFAAFFYYGMRTREMAQFPFPLYGYYALLFIVLSYAVTRGYRVITLRMLMWTIPLLGYGMWFFWLGTEKSLLNFGRDVRMIIDVVEANVFGQVVVGILIVFQVAAVFFLLWKRFGFLSGYRVFLTLLSAVFFASRYGFLYASGETGVLVSPKLSEWFSWAPAWKVAEVLELSAVNLLRLVVIEMAVYSFLKSFKPATDNYMKWYGAKQSATPVATGSPLVDATARLGNSLFRTALLLQQFFIQLGFTISSYAAALARTLRRVAIDFVIPVGSLVATAVLLALLAGHTSAYVTGSSPGKLIHLTPMPHPLVTIFVAIIIVFFVQMIFLGAVTKFPLRALWRCNTLLALWLAPFAVFLFVLISLSLLASGAVLKRYDTTPYPYRFGPLTSGAIVLLVVMLIYAFLHARFRSRSVEAAGTAGSDRSGGQAAVPGDEA